MLLTAPIYASVSKSLFCCILPQDRLDWGDRVPCRSLILWNPSDSGRRFLVLFVCLGYSTTVVCLHGLAGVHAPVLDKPHFAHRIDTSGVGVGVGVVNEFCVCSFHTPVDDKVIDIGWYIRGNKSTGATHHTSGGGEATAEIWIESFGGKAVSGRTSVTH